MMFDMFFLQDIYFGKSGCFAVFDFNVPAGSLTSVVDFCDMLPASADKDDGGQGA